MADIKLKDLSNECDFDDDNLDNDCTHCKYFLFPIGCMYFETFSEEEKDNGNTKNDR